MVTPIVVARSEHGLSRQDIDPDALRVLYRLHASNFEAYLVGGSVRDLLLHRRPKDFDIGTSAHPHDVKRLFRNCWIIGRRFRLAHVRFGTKTIEVATFRKQVTGTPEPQEQHFRPDHPDEGELPVVADPGTEVSAEIIDRPIQRDNEYGTPEEDAFRRQLELAGAHALPALVHTPHRDKVAGTRRTLALVAEVGLDPGTVLVDHLNELTVDLVDDAGAWLGFSIYPDTKMDPVRMVAVLQRRGLDRVLVNSAADWGRSDPLATARTAEAMLAAGFDADQVDQVLWRNPVEFFGQSGRLLLEVDEPDATQTFEGNSLLRGERVS